MTNDPQTSALPHSQELGRFAAARLLRLQPAYILGDPAAKATLARLRRAVPTNDDRVIEVWDTVFIDPPTWLAGSGDDITTAERSLVAALHLYSLHQQSQSSGMHRRGVGLGEAIHRLANPDDADSREKPVMRRYNALVTSNSFAERIRHLSGLVGQLRSAEVPLDYARLASDLYRLETPWGRTPVRLAWSRDLAYREKNSDKP